MNELLERLKMYEPLFGQWKVDFIAINYGDIHYYASALEYLIKRAQEEGKQIPADIYETPAYGKEKYDMRHPSLKQKPKR